MFLIRSQQLADKLVNIIQYTSEDFLIKQLFILSLIERIKLINLLGNLWMTAIYDDLLYVCIQGRETSVCILHLVNITST